MHLSGRYSLAFAASRMLLREGVSDPTERTAAFASASAPGDVAPDPDGRFPGGSREVAHAERIVPGSGRQRRCGRIGGVFGGVVAARSGEQREDQQKE